MSDAQQISANVQMGLRGVINPIEKLRAERKGMVMGDEGMSIYDPRNDITATNTPINPRFADIVRMRSLVKAAAAALPLPAPKLAPKPAPKPTPKPTPVPSKTKAYTTPTEETLAYLARAKEEKAYEDPAKMREILGQMAQAAKKHRVPITQKIETPEQAASAAGKIHVPGGADTYEGRKVEKGTLRPTFLGRVLGHKKLEFQHAGTVSRRPSNVSEKEWQQMGPKQRAAEEKRSLLEVPWHMRGSAARGGKRALPGSSIYRLGQDIRHGAPRVVGELLGALKGKVRGTAESVAKKLLPRLERLPEERKAVLEKLITEQAGKRTKEVFEGTPYDQAKLLGAQRAMANVPNEALPKGFDAHMRRKLEEAGLATKGTPERTVMPGRGEAMSPEEGRKALAKELAHYKKTTGYEGEQARKAVARDITGVGKRFRKEQNLPEDWIPPQDEEAVARAAAKAPKTPAAAPAPGAAAPGAPTPAPGADPFGAKGAPGAKTTEEAKQRVARAVNILPEAQSEAQRNAINNALRNHLKGGDVGSFMSSVNKIMSDAKMPQEERNKLLTKIFAPDNTLQGGPGGMSFETTPGGVKFTQTQGQKATSPEDVGKVVRHEIPAAPPAYAVKHEEDLPKDVRNTYWQWEQEALRAFPQFDARNPVHVQWAMTTAGKNVGKLPQLTKQLKDAGAFEEVAIGKAKGPSHEVWTTSTGPAPAPKAIPGAKPAIEQGPPAQALAGGPSQARLEGPVGAGGMTYPQETHASLGPMLQQVLPLLQGAKQNILANPKAQQEISTLMSAAGLKQMPAWAEQMLPMAGMMASMMIADQFGLTGVAPSMLSMFGGPMLASGVAGKLGYNPQARTMAEDAYMQGLSPSQFRTQVQGQPGMLSRLAQRVGLGGQKAGPDMDVTEAATA